MKQLVLLFAVAAMTVPALAFHSIPGRTYDCDSCHIPHKAQDLTDMPLWSGLKTSQENWTNYSSATMDTTPGSPEGPTLLCLACHDATDGHGHLINDVGGDLSGTHPIEIAYADAASLDPELRDPADPSNVANGRGTIGDDLVSATKGYVNCQSCHDIHIQGLHDQTVNFKNEDGTDGSFKFSIPHLVNMTGITWKTSYSGRKTPWLQDSWELDYGALCKTCHIK